jgi:PAS domain S-box-containing protein
MTTQEHRSVLGREELAAQAPDIADFPREYLRELLDALPVAIYATDCAGRLTYFNSAAVELAGRTPELGSDLWCVSWRLYGLDGTAMTHAECPMAVSLREGRPVRGVELIVERPDGTRLVCMPYPTPLRRPDGTIVGGINVLVDISDRKRAEEDLRDIDQRFTQFMHNLPGLAWIKDRHGRYVYANEAAERAFAIPLGDLLGRTDRDIFPPSTADEFAANDLRVLDTDGSIQTIETLEHDDGAVHHSIVSKFPIQGRDGTTTLIGGVAIDVTELKQTEEALRRSEAWFRTLAEASPALIWRLDPAGDFTYVNPPYLEYFGRHEDELLDRGWFPLLHPEDASAYMAAVGTAQRERGRLQAEVRVRHRNGDWRWIESYALPLFSDDKEYLGHIGTSLDITERKRVEEALAEADSRKDEFLAMLAHELRGPLAPIRNSIEIIRRMAAPATEDVVQTLERQVSQLVRRRG